MILQALCDYYERQRQQADSDIAPPGWVRRPVDYCFVLDADGQCVQIETRFEWVKARRVGGAALLPAIGKQALKHTNSGQDANLLWDNASFALGRGNRGAMKLASFIGTLETWLGHSGDAGVLAVLAFARLALAEPDAVTARLREQGVLEDFDERDPVLVFRLAADGPLPVHERAAVRAAYSARLAEQGDDLVRGRCLVTGAQSVPLAENETVIKGVWGGQPSGTNLVSFNASAFVSYGKQGRAAEVAPISKDASFAYSTSLNHLLASKRQRVQVGDASTVFWADRASRFDGEFTLADLFGNSEDPARGAQAVRALFEALETGQLPAGERDVSFFVLGLAAPSLSRLSVRFWLHAPFAELGPRIAQHFKDLAIVRSSDNDPPAPSLFRLLSSVALRGEAKNIPPRLASEWMRSILEGLPYPALLLNASVQRCRAERNVPYLRAAILKAWLNRNQHARFKEELDVNHDDAPYRLGRLFAVLERIQQRAQGNINTTIRDRYWGAASTTPASAFPALLKLKNAHLGKLGPGENTFYEKLIGDIFGSLEAPRLDGFALQQSLAEQGRFAIGYYHQRQSFFASKDDTATKEA
jgi:CRISPR-associated protein Csd1